MKLYDSFKKGEFIERPNRFVMRLLMDGEIIEAYTPNTGSLAEYLVDGQEFYVTPQKSGKYKYKVFSTLHNGFFIFLDTIVVNRIVFHLLRAGHVPGFEDVLEIRREFSLKNSRFDFMVTKDDGSRSVIEVKSCTLSHGGTAMFPDAPTERGQRHLRELELLSREGMECINLYLISDFSVKRFLPNFHTDHQYGRIFSESHGVKKLPLKIRFINPVTFNPLTLESVDVDQEVVAENNRDGGAYMLVLENPVSFKTSVGKLGEVDFKKGFYVYAGSARKNLKARLDRHGRLRKTIHWHIDHIVPARMKILKTFPIRRKDDMEENIAGDLLRICDGFVNGFGSTDSRQPSHLFRFTHNPLRKWAFFNILLDYRMFVK